MKKKLRGAFKYFCILMKYTFITSLILGTAMLIVLAFMTVPTYLEYNKEAQEAVSVSTKDTFQSSLTSYIYDDSEQVIAKLKVNRDVDYLEYDDIPEEVVNAFVAIEDRAFWDHNGFDLKGIARVGFTYVTSKGENVHGASTITQQLARNIFLSHEVTLERKAKEICYAVAIESAYTKEEIMEFYVNNIYYGNNYYGINSAAKGYFDKTADQLSLSQIAYLCAIPNSPSYYNPMNGVETAIPRRDKILNDMFSEGYISETELEDALEEDIVLNITENVGIQDYETTYAIDCAVKYLMKESGFEFRYDFTTMEDYEEYTENYNETYSLLTTELSSGGYQIYTSINAETQQILQESVDDILAFDEETGEDDIYELQGAATCIDVATGKVVAIVGGRSQEQDTFTLNRAFQSPRQPGSSIKPLIVYAPALEYGYTADSTVVNIDVTQAKKTGVDALSLSGTKMTLRQAVEQSKNGAAWRLFCELTPRVGLSYLQDMKFASVVPNDYYASASLGGMSYGTTTVEMAGGYAALANEGVHQEPTCIVSILDKNGDEIYHEEEEKQVYTKAAANEMVEILQGVIKSGTAKSMGWSLKVEAAGKTGTTNNSKDGWFCGITPQFAISVWVGYDTPRELSGLYGSTYPTQIWKQAMSQIVDEDGETVFLMSGDDGESERENKFSSSGASDYYSYLEGRDDDEELSSGYTVGDYRDDHTLADEAEAILSQLQGLGPDDAGRREALYQQANSLIEGIYGRTLYNEMKQKLDSAYNRSGEPAPSVQEEPEAPEVPVTPEEPEENVPEEPEEEE